ncbi:MAG: reverse transcriptase domain-containing protein [Erysipelotrichales bacterium]|jgi:hypothetical protein|nr:reverse transcriptase domain-containing protein [Erysipelotrichales bacterium]
MNIPQDIVIRYIKTKNKVRKIVTYRSDDCKLRAYHNKINNFLNENFLNSIFAKAYIAKQSIYKNAKAHMYNDYFIMMDVQNFFNSINHNNLVEKLYLELNRINENNITKKECMDIVNNCSINKVGIPLGFITSPILSNIYLKEFDGILYGKLKKLELENVIYTRYADDICISFKDNALNQEKEAEIISLTNCLLKRYRLKLNTNKTRSYNLKATNHVKITGVNIVKSADDYRTLSVGKKIKNALFWDAINCYKKTNRTSDEIDKIKGMQSFVLSVEKNGYESCYSGNMMAEVKKQGFDSLKELIDNLSANINNL